MPESKMPENPKIEIETRTAIDPRSLLAPEGFVASWKEGMSDEEYHADITAVGSTNVRVVLDSPKAFHARFFYHEQLPESDALRMGKLIHMAVLEPERFQKAYQVCPDFGDMRSPARKLQRAEWVESLPPGTVVIKKQDELDQIDGIVRSILSHKRGADFMREGIVEIPGIYRDDETGIRLKIKPDFRSVDGIRLNDLKSCLSSEPRAFANQVYQSRYDLQMFMQAEGIRHITGKFPDVISLIAVEKAPPYESAIYYFEREDLFQAELDYHTALKKLKTAIDKNHWPQRQTEIERIKMPQWFVYAASERN